MQFNALGLMGLQKGTQNNGIGSGKYFDLSTLARVTEGFTAGQMEQVVFDTLTPARLSAIGMRPLDV